MVLTSWFFLKTERKKNCTNRLKDERRRENRRTLSYSVSLKDTLRMKKTRKNKKKLRMANRHSDLCQTSSGVFSPFFLSFWKKLRRNQKMEESRVDVKKEKKIVQTFHLKLKIKIVSSNFLSIEVNLPRCVLPQLLPSLHSIWAWCFY